MYLVQGSQRCPLNLQEMAFWLGAGQIWLIGLAGSLYQCIILQCHVAFRWVGGVEIKAHSTNRREEDKSKKLVVKDSILQSEDFFKH